MKKTCFLLILIGFLCFLASPSQASFSTTWTDWYIEFPPVKLDATGYDQHSYTHDITSDGFRPLEDYVSDWSLELRLFDDFDRSEDEYLAVQTGVFDWPVWDTKYEVGFDLFDPITDEEWTLTGWLTLNLAGFLDVDLHATSGDFYFASSTLRANGVSVPEPATMLLLGLGLVGLAGVGRKKFFKK